MNGVTAEEERGQREGWLSETVFFRAHSSEARLLDEILVRTTDVAEPLPHTFLTGLYGMGPGRIALWYPGGGPGLGLNQIRYRRAD